MSKNFKIIFAGFVGIVFSLVIPATAGADYIGQKTNFFVDSGYDISSREKISATLQTAGLNYYFYLDDNWLNSLNSQETQEVVKNLQSLGNEFDSRIYRTLTSTYGSEWKPGIDKDRRVTILIHPMKKGAGGYFSSGNEYLKLQVQNSNQREMVYLNSDYITQPIAKSYLAHEFTHLITFNQKDKLRGVEEETWLNEARAEYAPTLLGYDDVYKNSNLQNRAEEFLKNPSDSLTEWQNKTADYGALNLFIQYLVDHYGKEILSDSLKSSKKGIPSINEALSKNGFSEDFSQIFTDWTIAVLINDCSLGQNYCYKNENLKNLKIIPQINFLPLTGESTLSVYNTAHNWAGNWKKIIGGTGNLTLEFDGADAVNFKVPYLVCDFEEKCSINFLTLDEEQEGEITLPDFNTKYSSLTIVPSVQEKVSGFNGKEEPFSFSFKVSTAIKTKEEKEAELISRLLAQIEELKRQIAEVHAKINAILIKRGQISCQKFENNLYYGLKSSEVSCLQEFLKAQGSEVYPQGLITGFFGPLTQSAVILFQEKYASEILTPLGLSQGTGFVGPSTRSKINQLLTFSF